MIQFPNVRPSRSHNPWLRCMHVHSAEAPEASRLKYDSRSKPWRTFLSPHTFFICDTLICSLLSWSRTLVQIHCYSKNMLLEQAGSLEFLGVWFGTWFRIGACPMLARRKDGLMGRWVGAGWMQGG